HPLLRLRGPGVDLRLELGGGHRELLRVIALAVGERGGGDEREGGDDEGRNDLRAHGCLLRTVRRAAGGGRCAGLPIFTGAGAGGGRGMPQRLRSGRWVGPLNSSTNSST